GVTVEARYAVAEYDVSILSAEDSDGLIRWLTDNGYKIPQGAEPVIGSYIKQKMHFFVAKVNLKRMQDSGRAYLRPLQGRYEASNYRTIKVPSDVDVPFFVKNDFANFYKATFEHAVARENMHGVFVEYAWDMGWCDPCAAAPMSKAELTELGALWDGGDGSVANRLPAGSSGNAAFVTRLHVRHDAKSFPEDLNFVETSV